MSYKLYAVRGVEFTGQPEQKNWGGILVHFKDPDGNTITLLGGPGKQ